MVNLHKKLQQNDLRFRQFNRSNLARGDIMASGTARSCLVVKWFGKTCRYILSYSSGGRMRREVGLGVHMKPPFGGKVKL